jgi:Predicted hydrolases or acyltransferases (alpha/beta hydrolase superfamily)
MTPFKIEISEEVLQDLQKRLSLTRWPDNPEHDGWSYGTNANYLKELVSYWQEGYDWRKQETLLNSLPQFKAVIDGVEIHFVYVKGKGKNPKPLILTHGWPDSFFRYYKVIPMLADPEAYGGDPAQSFDVIVPSVPGFGFSSKTVKVEDEVAGIWLKLMKNELGYHTFYAAGGDVGSGITKALANQFPDAVKAIHLTDVGYPNGTEDWSTMSQAEQEFGQFIQQWWMSEGAYNMIQSTKPQSLSYGLNDSPVGLAAWIVEKFHAWSDHNGQIEKRFTKDELLTNIMIYWVTETISTSVRYYADNARVAYTAYGPKPVERVKAPTGVAAFPGDAPLPKEWAERMANVTRFTKMPKGGHFAPLSVPDEWVGEVRKFFFGSDIE